MSADLPHPSSLRDSAPPALLPARTIRVDAESAGQRLDVFLAATLAEHTRATWQKLIESGHIRLEGRTLRPSHRVRGGERISISEPEPEPATPEPQAIPLTILFQDEDILVLNKPPDLVIHPAPGSPDGTLVNALLFHCKDLSGIGGVRRPGIVHRLDRNTSGVMVVTKNDSAHQSLSHQFAEHTVEKQYLAFCVARDGAPTLPEKGVFDTLFGRHPIHRKRFSSTVRTGKQAITHYQVLETYTGDRWRALKVLALPKTGRTHQIRVHLADHGQPLLGDTLYGGRSARFFPQELNPPRHALHALRLAFIHPRRREKVFFEAPLAPDLADLEAALESAAVG